MRIDLIAQWRKDIVGEWKSDLMGIDLLLLETCAGRSTVSLTLRADGTAVYDFSIPASSAPPPRPAAPFPQRWELGDDGVLSVWLPVAPMPEYGQPEWSREQMCYDVMAVSELSLALSTRRFDGEHVYVLRRVNVEEHNRRKAEEYGRLLQAMKEWTGKS